MLTPLKLHLKLRPNLSLPVNAPKFAPISPPVAIALQQSRECYVIIMMLPGARLVTLSRQRCKGRGDEWGREVCAGRIVCLCDQALSGCPSRRYGGSGRAPGSCFFALCGAGRPVCDYT